MRTVETFLMGALALIALYLIVTSSNVSQVVDSLARGFGKIFSTLQGR